MNLVDAFRRLLLKANEYRYGIDTSAVISLDALGLSHPERRKYGATEYADFRRLMRLVPTKGEVFVDYGSGLGRVLVLAATYPLAKVIGVELSDQLCELARRNVSKAKPRRKVEVVNSDATAFAVPDEATLFYFNNPFAGSILTSVLERIRVSSVQSPRKIYLICNLPPKSNFEDDIAKVDWLRLETSIIMSWHQRKGLIFTISPSCP